MSSDTYRRLILDAGQIRIGYVDEANPGALLGATRGGAVFEVAGEMREMPADGAKGVVKGCERITRVVAAIEVTVVEIVSWVLRLALPGSARANWPTVTPTHDELRRYLALSLAGYSDTVALLAEVSGTEEPVIVTLRNCIGRGGLTAAMIEGDELGIKIRFEAHIDPAEVTEEPWSVKSIKEEAPEPVETLVGWWAGEDDATDGSGRGHDGTFAAIPDSPPNYVYTISYDTGFVDRCFKIDYFIAGD